MKPEWHINCSEEGCYLAGVKDAKGKGRYIRASISKKDLGHLLQGKHITLLFLNDGYEQEAMLDIELSEGKTVFEVSDILNELVSKEV
jgi:hypothetical protein